MLPIWKQKGGVKGNVKVKCNVKGNVNVNVKPIKNKRGIIKKERNIPHQVDAVVMSNFYFICFKSRVTGIGGCGNIPLEGWKVKDICTELNRRHPGIEHYLKLA